MDGQDCQWSKLYLLMHLAKHQLTTGYKCSKNMLQGTYDTWPTMHIRQHSMQSTYIVLSNQACRILWDKNQFYGHANPPAACT